jgi:hypothetical protein
MDEEAVLCVDCAITYPVPRSARRTGVFYILLSDASSAFSALRPGEYSSLLRLECSKAVHAVKTEHRRQ